MPNPSDHARDRMAERDITGDDVRLALNRQRGTPSVGDNGNTVVYGYASKGRILKVVLTPDRETIVTVMWLDG
jgi:hypothetical protein